MASIKHTITMYKTNFSKVLQFRGSSCLLSCLKERHFLRQDSSFVVRWYSEKFTDFSKRGNNVILMGSPGCGKTTIGQILASRLGKQVVDVDNDHLEKLWKTSVADKLTEVGSVDFLEAEGQALLQLSCDNSVISLSGSNPMHHKAMRYVHSLGTVIFLDVDDTDILERLERMKVDRIVGQNDGTSLADILKYRKQFYEGNYDLRVICERSETPESISSKVINSVNSLTKHNGFISTRHRKDVVAPEKRFLDVVLEGLAPDGGLFVPNHGIPRMTLGEFERLVPLSFQERALRILEQWISPHDLHPSQLKQMIDSAYHSNFQHEDIAPVVKVEEPFYALELFHGPTASFKDLALQLTPFFFGKAVSQSLNKETKYLIVVATTGDTGSAVLEGFRDCGSTDVLVLYPANGVSSIQRRHMKTTDSLNSMVLGVDGDFDFCQSAIKRIFNDTSFCRHLQNSFNVKLSAANSINWGRLLPQVIYHVSSYLELVKNGVIGLGEKADTCVPTGNFGNILAAYYAKEMGVPFDDIICASNVNNVLTDFFQNGVYDISDRNLHRTASPSIDIFKSSNLERLLYHVTSCNSEMVTQLFNSLEKEKLFQVDEKLQNTLSSTIKSGWCSEQDCLTTIKTVFNRTGYLQDPHTAIARTVADNFISTNKPMVISATAHYGRFAYSVLKALGKDRGTKNPLALIEELQLLQPNPSIHKQLVEALKKPEIHNQVCTADVLAVKEHIETFLKLKNLEKKWEI